MSAPSTRCTFPRSRRIRKRADFVRVQEGEGGARVSTRHFLILLALRHEEGPARLGVVASRKIGGAVERNRAKRLLRDAFRRSLDLFPANIDVVMIVRPGAHELVCHDVIAELTAVAPLLGRRAAALLRAGRGGGGGGGGATTPRSSASRRP